MNWPSSEVCHLLMKSWWAKKVPEARIWGDQAWSALKEGARTLGARVLVGRAVACEHEGAEININATYSSHDKIWGR